jgi:hypothetical protein
MSNPLLVAIANATPYNATMVSTNGGGSDNTTIPAFNNAFTGGSDANNIHIPECSDSSYYAEHHILITGKNSSGAVMWTVSLWANDDNNAVLYWNNTDGYSANNPIPNTGGNQVISAIYIGTDANGNIFVNATARQT